MLQDLFYKIANQLIGILGDALGLILSLLPNSPFTAFDNSAVLDFLPTLNWFLPISAILAVMETWLTAILVYYCYMIVLRWIKALG